MPRTTTRSRCTCEAPSEYNERGNPAYDRHEINCKLAPDVEGWLWYPHDGELEEGGVLVNPIDRTCVYLLVRGYLCRAPLSADNPIGVAEEADAA
jgi:hypothetical protein